MSPKKKTMIFLTSQAVTLFGSTLVQMAIVWYVTLNTGEGAFVIDTPGMRELGMWDSDGGIDTAFRDIEELSRKCRFSDCSHTSEPGCAVRAALEDGTLEGARWESYRKLKSENKFAADSSRYLEAKRAKFKEIAKLNKSNRKK